ncbi:hypothetical protein [Jannaschia seohaensis]|uniref:Uncharacterized protein n=1 Tax=Jannaschia seohaensis TaxID=475081 RepID=A0A2Y9A284_9RHOB|nr:hypothetical protein [Jannaschia seohaensis]PWJ22097.1 hypothetical protein BCF38_101506 [Jannaschia seohaensis]SSA38375.1 hypothetical protein SAMN05421539_101506 [Jannaschia seohaensis]
MTPSERLTALPLITLITGCVAGGNDVVTTPSEIEATTDSDIDGGGTVPQGGVAVGATG